jgi:hypothetical protein
MWRPARVSADGDLVHGALLPLLPRVRRVPCGVSEFAEKSLPELGLSQQTFRKISALEDKWAASGLTIWNKKSLYLRLDHRKIKK